MRTAVRACLGLLTLALVVLVATGAWLWFRYRPGVGWIGDVHLGAAIAFVAIAGVVVVLAVVRRVRDDTRVRSRRWRCSPRRWLPPPSVASSRGIRSPCGR